MKWVNRFLVVFLFVLLFSVPVGSTLAETTPPTYSELLSELTQIWKELNSLSVNSEVTLIDMQERWPSLIKRVEDFGNKLTVFEKDQANMSENMKVFNQNFSTSALELQVLKSQFGEVSSLVGTLRTSYTGIEEEVKRMKRRTNTGLVISIIAAIIGAIALGYEIFNGVE